MRIAIIGGGASGLFTGAQILPSNEVTIFDGNEKVGKKIYITGKGRCNLTNDCDKETYLANVVNGQKFMMSAISKFSPKQTIDFFENAGLKLKTERGNRVFPVSDKASDVTKILLGACKHCDIKLNEKVVSIKYKNEKFELKTLDKVYQFDKVVIATGGVSYPLTGSTGDGYKFAQSFGHKIVEPKSALSAIELQDNFVKDLMGLSLKNVKLHAKADGKEYSLFGEMLFTDKGISGPIALSMSSLINRCKNVNLSIDFKPALNLQQIEERLMRDFSNNLNKNISVVMRGLLPKSLVEVFLKKIHIDDSKKVNSITVTERKEIANKLKNFDLTFSKLYPVETGIITSGGVDLNEINPKTMESKLQKGLYFVGEVLNVDCLTGGFNLQTAFSTAYACAAAINSL